MTTYRLIKSITTGEVKVVLRDEKDSIPFNLESPDYQAYLKWLDEGNTPLPADE